jgi:glycosyltransferase involved in cell wall biosynthesis
MMFYTNIQRDASDILAEPGKKVQVDESEAVRSMHRIKEIGRESRRALEAGDVTALGAAEQQLREMATDLGVAERVMIRSFGPDERGGLGRLVSDADLVCLLSDYEAHPVAVMEAIGTGTRALVADTSGLSELGRAGLATTIAIEATPDQIAAAAMALVDQPRMPPSTMPTWDDCANGLLRLYRDVAT